jgi:hypothetical protein
MEHVECPICFLPITRQLSFLQCKHKICLTCAVKWLYKKNFCPICRSSSETLLVFDPETELSSISYKDQLSIELSSTSSDSRTPSNTDEHICDNVSIKDNLKILNESRNFKEKSMSLTELISTYWEEVKKVASSQSKMMDEDDEMEEVDISIFFEDLKQIVSLTQKTKANLDQFDSHIFYSELYDVMEDIKRTNDYYMKSLNERDPSVSKFYLACFLEHAFKFLDELNESLKVRDIEMVNYLLSIVDEVYYNSYIEYYYRGYEEPEEQLEESI